jgi:hypothetical protein
MTALKMAFHQGTGRRMVEILDDDGNMIGAIYATHDGSNAIHIVSKYFEDDPIDQSISMIPVPGYIVHFKRRTP